MSDRRNCTYIPEGRKEGPQASRAWTERFGTELALAAQREAGALEPNLPVVAWIHRDNAASQAVARHLGLTDYGQLAPQHWNRRPMHRWADRPPVSG